MDISVAGGGVHQVKRHCQTRKHVNLMKEMKDQPTIHTSLQQAVAQNHSQDQVYCAELYFARFVAEHNLPFAVADHLTSYVQ